MDVSAWTFSAMDISAIENAKGGRFGYNHKLWVGDGCIHLYMHACMCDALLGFNSIFNCYSSDLEALGFENCMCVC